MSKIKTESGITFELDEDRLDDWRVLEAIAKMDSDQDAKKLTGIVNLIDMIFGKDKDALIEQIASKNDGRVPVETMREVVDAIFSENKKAKNSQASQG